MFGESLQFECQQGHVSIDSLASKNRNGNSH